MDSPSGITGGGCGLASCTDVESLQNACMLYKGDYLEGDYGEWVTGERARLADAYENVLAKLVEASSDARLAERLLERNPYSEAAYRVLIEERLAVGAFASAARIAERCRAALAEVGASPSDDFLMRVKPVTLAPGPSLASAQIARGVVRSKTPA